jgi:hypothetical protein
MPSASNLGSTDMEYSQMNRLQVVFIILDIHIWV